MQSWSLKKFVKDMGMDEARRVSGIATRQGVWAAYPRGMQIIEADDGHYEVWIKQLKRRVLIDE